MSKCPYCRVEVDNLNLRTLDGVIKKDNREINIHLRRYDCPKCNKTIAFTNHGEKVFFETGRTEPIDQRTFLQGW
jgi:hypothetical protein